MNPKKTNFSASEYSAQQELARIRETFSFRFGLLVTESFFRKPWLIPLFPFRMIGLFLNKSAPKRLEYKNSDGPETCILFSTSEEGLASVERALHRSAQLEKIGIQVIHVSSSRHASHILQSKTHYMLPDPKNKSVVQSTSEWNETCLNFLHHIVMSNNVTTLEFDGPYPYRGVLNLLKIHPHIKSIWKRLATRIPSKKEHIELFDEMDVRGIEFSDFSKPEKPILFHAEEPRSIFVGIGYDHREGIGKGRNSIIRQLKQNANHHVILYGHVEISNSMLSPLPISRWDSTGNKLSRENIQFAIVPPNPTLLEQLALRGIPTIIVCDETVPVEVILKLRSRSMTEPLSILQNPDAEEIKVSMQPFLQERLNPPGLLH